MKKQPSRNPSLDFNSLDKLQICTPQNGSNQRKQRLKCQGILQDHWGCRQTVYNEKGTHSKARQRFSTSRTTSGSRTKVIIISSCNDINTKIDQLLKFSMAQFLLVVGNRETKFVSGPRVSKGW